MNLSINIDTTFCFCVFCLYFYTDKIINANKHVILYSYF